MGTFLFGLFVGVTIGVPMASLLVANKIAGYEEEIDLLHVELKALNEAYHKLSQSVAAE